MKRKFDGVLIVFTIFVIALDYFIYCGWKFIIDHETCVIEGIKQICWGSSPMPTYAITFSAMILTLLASMMWATWWSKNE